MQITLVHLYLLVLVNLTWLDLMISLLQFILLDIIGKLSIKMNQNKYLFNYWIVMNFNQLREKKSLTHFLTWYIGTKLCSHIYSTLLTAYGYGCYIRRKITQFQSSCWAFWGWWKMVRETQPNFSNSKCLIKTEPSRTSYYTIYSRGIIHSIKRDIQLLTTLYLMTVCDYSRLGLFRPTLNGIDTIS